MCIRDRVGHQPDDAAGVRESRAECRAIDAGHDRNHHGPRAGKRRRGGDGLGEALRFHADQKCCRWRLVGGWCRAEPVSYTHLDVYKRQVPRSDGEGVAALLPTGAEHSGDRWRFILPDEGIEPLLETLMARGHGIAGLSIERPGLHDAFVRIVGQANAGDVA